MYKVRNFVALFYYKPNTGKRQPQLYKIIQFTTLNSATNDRTSCDSRNG